MESQSPHDEFLFGVIQLGLDIYADNPLSLCVLHSKNKNVYFFCKFCQRLLCGVCQKVCPRGNGHEILALKDRLNLTHRALVSYYEGQEQSLKELLGFVAGQDDAIEQIESARKQKLDTLGQLKELVTYEDLLQFEALVDRYFNNDTEIARIMFKVLQENKDNEKEVMQKIFGNPILYIRYTHHGSFGLTRGDLELLELDQYQTDTPTLIEKELTKGFYVGESKDDLRHGNGATLFSALEYYSGQYFADKMHGRGSYNYAKGGKYVGEFNEGKRTGKIVYKHGNGEMYYGDYVDHKMHGRGIYFYQDGSVYIGFWVEGKQNGLGQYNFHNGEKYFGDYANGKRNGRGYYQYHDKSYYFGDMKDDQRHGQGMYKIHEGPLYEGAYENNQRQGYGITTLPNGEKQFEGGYEAGKPHGKGVQYYEDGSKFEGQFMNGFKNGKGFLTSDTTVSRGMWNMGEKEGEFEELDVKTGEKKIVFYKGGVIVE